MYRKASSTSVLAGVPSGPYTGGKRVIDGARLDPATRDRIHTTLSLRGQPSPIAYQRPGAQEGSRPVWGVIGATMGLSTFFAVGFGNLDSDWATPAWWSLGIYLSLALLFALSLLPLLRRRALVGGTASGALRPGRYLFPLDAVEIDEPDAAGRQRVTVYPLGDARHVDVEIGAGKGKDNKRVDLAIRFEGGETVRFPLRGDHNGSVALRRLEHAQRLLEDLTYKRGLEEAFANDLFFDLRVDKGWDRYPLESGPAPVRTPNLVSLVLGRFAPLLVAAVTLTLGLGTFFLRREAGDTALWNHAVAYGSPDALDRYLARGGRKRLAAEDAKTRLIASATEQKRREEQQRARDRRRGFDAVDEPAVDQRCIEALEARVSPAHPQAVPALVRSVKESRVLNVSIEVSYPPREPNPGRDRVFELDNAITAAERNVREGLEEVFADICPKSVLHVERFRYDARLAPHLVVSVRPRWLNTSWHLVDRSGKPFDAQQLHFDFHVELHDNGGELVESFDLPVPPPPDPPIGLRPRSLFVLPGDVRDPLPPGVFDRRVYFAMVDRAYDKLYDELWSLFFKGEPRVPLVPSAVLTP